jgi:energy-coupling factor transporter ATP-binding protein EcfA2
MARLVSLRTFGVPGLPDSEIGLLPVTALVGARGSGKSRLLAAIAWLLTGAPELARPEDAAPVRVEAVLEDEAGQRAIARDAHGTPIGSLPPTVLLGARERLRPLEPAPSGRTDPNPAELMIARLEERWRTGERGSLVLIEEPELDLNPQTQRYLYRVMRGFSAANQVIYSTRSPSFVDAVHHAEIVRLDISGAGMAVRRAPQELMSDEERLRLAAEFNHERGEMFFANAVVLVEGQTEAQSLPIIFRSLGQDPDELGIAITEVGGKGNLVLAAKVLAELNIPHMLVYDSDRGHPAAEMNKGIDAAVGATPRVRLEPDFEGAAGIHHHDDKVLHAWRRFAHATPDQIPPVFHHIVEVAGRLAHGQPVSAASRRRPKLRA